MAIDIDLAAIAIMESFGIVSFLVAFLFFRQRQRIRDKQRAFLDAVDKRVISVRGDGKCFSSKWVMDNIVYKPRKLLNATLLFATIVGFLLAIIYYGILPIIFVNMARIGYAVVVALIGIAILLWTDAFESYGYARAIYTVATEQLDKEDQSYIELSREALEKAFLRFFSLGVAFAVFGPFIPQIFNGVVYFFLQYASIYFGASEASFKALTFFGGVLIILILPVLMLILPEFLGRIMIRKGKSIFRRLFKRRVEQ